MSLLGVGCGLDQSPTPLLYFLLSDQQDLCPSPLAMPVTGITFGPNTQRWVKIVSMDYVD